MSFLDRYGPRSLSVPTVKSRIFYVSPSDEVTIGGRVYKASDNYQGTEPHLPLRTINRAWTLATASQGDVIALLPGTHTLTTSVAASKAGVQMVGLGGSIQPNFMSQRVVVVGPSGDQAINVTAADIEIANIRFTCITAISCIDFSSAANRLYIHDCSFDMTTPAANTATIGIDALGAAAQVLVDHCYWTVSGAQGPAIDMTATLDSVVQGCVFQQLTGTWASAFTTGAATDRLVIRDCDFQVAGTAMTVGIDGTGATIANGVQIVRCYFGKLATVAIDNFSAGTAQLATNYTADAGTPGGTLLVAIT